MTQVSFFARPHYLVLALAALLPAAASAQQIPNAGRILQEQATEPQPPAPSPELNLSSPVPGTVAPGGPQASVTRIDLTGNQAFSTEQLLARLGDYQGKSYDLAGMQDLANQLTRYYRDAGYPFARVYLPAQGLENGVLRLQVVEGRYGEVKTEGDAGLAARAQAYLSPLKSGDIIESASLERAALLLSDLPGVTASPIIRPGQQLGTGDLVVQVDRGDRVNGSVGLDNQGNRYTGQYRANAALSINSPFMLGDQITLRAQRTSESLNYGDVGYSAPLGSSGLRGRVGYGYTGYELGKEFSDLDAHGTAKVASVGLSYPLIRSQSRNLTIGIDFLHKKLRDDYRAAEIEQNKFSNSVPIAAQFDVRDSLGGGGLTYGALSWTPGTLKLDGNLATADSLSANSAGHYSKLNLDIARLQSVSSRWSLFGRFSGQWTNDNLDSSEDFGLGGPAGVRAYPVGEGYGDRGWLAQVEVRYAAGAVTPFAFYDAGRVEISSHPWQAGENFRRVAGAGVGARVAVGGWRGEATVAWRTDGGAPQSDSRDHKPLFWVSAQYLF
ncbi:ShlB/FhaC/HecB family hemolysin secretion/activation protein [Achromobacter marplatensis]|uniref:ShlB/FhaC/HecB family hemolysin secretion/activation protein n=1 Tax=Achromobacter marplatensis TaxID=470868 RepID=A0AA42W8W2_9BURK|nr:ShlB/FhaC/HecB family hemolysin secretion/activation protein [Achromobacter marplatensis]MDH2050803.1 ShlB/FhaC/HecB family hemolysin secretion/activation protein [Achromobacter marplatensis]